MKRHLTHHGGGHFDARLHHRWLIAGIIILCLALYFLATKRLFAESKPVVVVKDDLAGDIPSLNAPARVVLYDSGLLIFRRPGTQPISTESTSLEYSAVQLDRAQYGALVRSLPLQEAYLQPKWTGVQTPWLLTLDGTSSLNSGTRRNHGVVVEAANYTEQRPDPGAQARSTVYDRLISYEPVGAREYTAPTYTMRLYPTTPDYTPGQAASWRADWSDVTLPSDIANGLPRTDRRYFVTITGDQYRRLEGYLAGAGATRGLMLVRGYEYQVEFSPHLPGESAWGGDSQESFLWMRDALHNTIADPTPRVWEYSR